MVREVGRNVVMRLAALEATTARKRNKWSGLPITGSARAPKTLSAISSFPRPSPSVSTPAYICVAMATSRYVSRIDTTHSSAARPGVFSEFLDSSFTVRYEDDHLEPNQDELDVLGRGDAPVGHRGCDGQEGQAGDHVDQLVLPIACRCTRCPSDHR
jgi:hypothetical protein